MKTDLLSISKIFTERLLRIPDYQRGYAWTEKQWKYFWNDLEQLEEDKNHYLGVLTLEEVPSNTIKKWEEDHWIIHSKSYTPFYIVDGQQRLTTIIVFIQAIIESLKENALLNYTTIADIKKKFLYDSKGNGISRSYLFGYEKDNPSYEFLKTKIFLEKSDNSFPLQETIYTKNLELAKKFFLGKIENIERSELEKLYRKITQNFLFNIYSISDEIDVYITFETMNNRGKALSHLELLKNRLIYLSTKFYEEEFERNKLRNSINEAWKSINHFLGKNKQKLLDDDLFLQTHFLIHFGKTLLDKNELGYRLKHIHRGYKHYYKEYLLEKEFTTKKIQDDVNPLTISIIHSYVGSLKESVEIWYQILNPDDSYFSDEEKTWLEKLNRLGIDSLIPLIMVFFQNQKEQGIRIRLLKTLEKLMFFHDLVKYKYYLPYDSFMFLELSYQLSSNAKSSEKVLKEIESQLEENLSNKELMKQIKNGFRQNGFYNWKGVKYFLYEYDLHLKSKSKTSRNKIDWETYIEDSSDYHTVEHIYPQNPKRKCWTEKYKKYVKSKERSLLRHSLGNLVPLSKPKNSSFQNNCFVEKKGDASNLIGFIYGSYSENEIATNEDWTAKEILERGIKLLSFMEERWGIKIGVKNEKIEFLNLGFVVKRENLPSE